MRSVKGGYNMGMKLRVHSVESFSTHDGLGIRTVVFLQGCNFCCKYCHNPDTQAMENGQNQLLSAEEILNILEKNRPYFGAEGGLTVSGGEPTVQTEGLIKLFKLVKENKIKTALDTNGGLMTPGLEELYTLSDLVIFDLKHFFNLEHQRLTNCENVNTLQNIARREEMGMDYWVRLVLVPGWTDGEEHLRAWAKNFERVKLLKKVEILPYHTMGKFKYEDLGRKYELEEVRETSEKDVERAKGILQEYISVVV